MASIEYLLDSFVAHRPILLVDADEVLLRFMQHLELHANDEGYEVRLDSFQLTGNIYNKSSGTVASPSVVKGLIGSFFDQHVDTIPAVEGAAAALDGLSKNYQIAVLTNVPSHCRERRALSLKHLGFPYPVISNSGEKGPAVRKITDFSKSQVVFVDDLPPQLDSVAKHAPDTHLVHFVADPRLGKLIKKAPTAHVRIDEWDQLASYLHALI
jgi:hypothetical protein